MDPQNTERRALLGLVLGVNGTGKTTMLKKMAKSAMERGDRVLILTPDEVEWEKIPWVHPGHPERIGSYTGIRKMLITDNSLEIIDKYFRKGLLIIDDARSFIGARTDEEVRRFCIRRRQRMMDMFFVAHDWTEMPPALFSYFSHIFLFETNGNVRSRKDRLSNIQYYEHMQQLVNEKAYNQPHYMEILTQRKAQEFLRETRKSKKK